MELLKAQIFRVCEVCEMKYMLVMPRIVSKVGDAYQFPLGLPYVSAALKQADIDVITVNLNQIEGTVEEILVEKIANHNIDVIMTGGLSFQYWPIYQILEIVKNYDNSLLTIVGGGIISSDADAAIKALEYVDIAVVGEGDITTVELCNVLNENKGLSDIQGIIWKNEAGEYVKNPDRAPVPCLDDLPWPDFDGFDLKKTFDYTPGISGLNSTRTIYMLSSRSCPYQCSFCFHTVSRKYRQRSLDSFFLELDAYVKKYKINFICIADELFSYNNERVIEFCNRIKKYNIGWWAQFRVDSLEPWLIPMLKESGCQVMSFGLESADNRVLKSMGKHITIEQTDATLKKVHEAGMPFEGAFIFGDTAETYETACNTLNYWLKHPEYRINLNTITVFPGCPLYKNALRTGIIKDPVKYLKDGCPQINMTQMSREEFSYIVANLLKYPHLKARKLENEILDNVDYSKARVDLRGRCVVCGKENSWKRVKLFVANGLACENCGQRYNVFMPNALKKTFEGNIMKLAEKGLTAIWGMNYVTTKLFDESKILGADNNIIPVDSSTIKQGMQMGTHYVQAPDIINEKDIKTVVIAIPAFYHEIALQIHYMYTNVENVIDICDLIRDDCFE